MESRQERSEERFQYEEARETEELAHAHSGKKAVRILEDKRRLLKIRRSGKKILDSEVFRKSLTQTHHYNNTVGGHSMEVVEVGLHLAEFLEKHGIHVNEDEVIKICLLHDMGIVGRYDKFRNNFVTNFEHPKDSVKAALEIYPDLSKKAQKNIARHMFPSTFMFPTNREGWILVAADKIASMHDVQRRVVGKHHHLSLVEMESIKMRKEAEQNEKQPKLLQGNAV